MKILSLFFLLLITSNAWTAFSCQTKNISPGMTKDEVISLCGDPLEMTDETESQVCSSNYQSTQTNCYTVTLQTLIYKVPTRYNVELVNGKVDRLVEVIYDH